MSTHNMLLMENRVKLQSTNLVTEITGLCVIAACGIIRSNKYVILQSKIAYYIGC